jgi:hypothetical protein
MPDDPARPRAYDPARFGASDQATAPAGLDLAFGWLQRNLDELTAASRRRASSPAAPPQ